MTSVGFVNVPTVSRIWQTATPMSTLDQTPDVKAEALFYDGFPAEVCHLLRKLVPMGEERVMFMRVFAQCLQLANSTPVKSCSCRCR